MILTHLRFASRSLLALAALCSSFSYSSASGTVEDCDKAIQNLKGNRFRVDRDLAAYSAKLPFAASASLPEMVAGLKEGSIWIDLGTGEAKAILEGLRANPRVFGIGIAYERPPGFAVPESLEERFAYLDGRTLESMRSRGQLDPLLGGVDLITEVYGPLSYSRDFPRVLQIAFDLLKVGGVLAFNLMMETNAGLNGGIMAYPYKRNAFRPRSGTAASEEFFDLRRWLEGSVGIEIVEETESRFSEGEKWERDRVFKLRKTLPQVRLPAPRLQTVKFVAAQPPIRTFALAEPNQ